MKHSTGRPTKAEARRIVAAKEGQCRACAKLGHVTDLCEYQHVKRGNRRIGHMAGYALCDYHHRGVLPEGRTRAWMREHFGPCLSDGSKPFVEAFGAEALLIAEQDEALGTNA